MAQTVSATIVPERTRARVAIATGLAVCMLLCAGVIAAGQVSATEPDAAPNAQDGNGNVSPNTPDGNADLPPPTAEDAITHLVMAWRTAVLDSDGAAYLRVADAKMIKTFEDELADLQVGVGELSDANQQRRIPGWGERTFADVLTMKPADLVAVYLEGLSEEYRAEVKAITGASDIVLAEDGLSAAFDVQGGMAEPPRRAVFEQGEWKLKLSADD